MKEINFFFSRDQYVPKFSKFKYKFVFCYRFFGSELHIEEAYEILFRASLKQFIEI